MKEYLLYAIGIYLLDSYPAEIRQQLTDELAAVVFGRGPRSARRRPVAFDNIFNDFSDFSFGDICHKNRTCPFFCVSYLLARR